MGLYLFLICIEVISACVVILVTLLLCRRSSVNKYLYLDIVRLVTFVSVIVCTIILIMFTKYFAKHAVLDEKPLATYELISNDDGIIYWPNKNHKDIVYSLNDNGELTKITLYDRFTRVRASSDIQNVEYYKAHLWQLASTIIVVNLRDCSAD